MEKRAQEIVRSLREVHEHSIVKRNAVVPPPSSSSSSAGAASATSSGGGGGSPPIAATQDLIRELEALNKLLSGTWKNEDELFNLKEALIACDLPEILLDVYYEIANETPKSYICIFLMDLLASPELPSSSTTTGPRFSTTGISIASKVAYYETPDLVASLEQLIADSTPTDASPSPSAFPSNEGAAAVAKYASRLIVHLLSAEANAIDFVNHTKFMKFAMRQVTFRGPRFVDVMQILSLLSTFAKCRPRLRELNVVEILIPLARDKGNLRAVVVLCNLIGSDPQASHALREIPNFFVHLVSVLKLALDSSTVSSTSMATWSLVDASLPCWICSQLPENRAEMAKLDILTLLRKVVDQAMATDDPEACQLAIGTFLQFAFFFKRSEAAAIQMRLDELNTKTGVKPAPLTRSGSWVAMNRASKRDVLAQSRSMSFRRKAEAGRWNKCVAIIGRMIDELDAFAESGVDVEGGDEEAILDAMAHELNSHSAPLPSTSPLEGGSTNTTTNNKTENKNTSSFSNRRALLRMNNALTTGLLPVPIERSLFVKLTPLVSPVGEMQVDLEYELRRTGGTPNHAENKDGEEEETEPHHPSSATTSGVFTLGRQEKSKRSMVSTTPNGSTLGHQNSNNKVPRRSELMLANSASLANSNLSASNLTPRRSNLSPGVVLLPTPDDVAKWLGAVGLKSLVKHFQKYDIRGATMKEMFDSCGVKTETLEKQKEKRRLLLKSANASNGSIALNPTFNPGGGNSPSTPPPSLNLSVVSHGVSSSNTTSSNNNNRAGASSTSPPATPSSAKSTNTNSSENSASLRKSIKNVSKILLRSFSSANKDGGPSPSSASGVLNGTNGGNAGEDVTFADLEDDAEVDNVMRVFKIDDEQEAARLLHSLKVLYGYA